MGTNIYAGVKDSNDLIYVVKESPIVVFKEMFPTYRVLNYEGVILDENENSAGFNILENRSFLGSTDSIDDLLSRFHFPNTEYDDDSLKNIYRKLITRTESNHFLEASKYVGSILGYPENDVLNDFKDIKEERIDFSSINQKSILKDDRKPSAALKRPPGYKKSIIQNRKIK